MPDQIPIKVMLDGSSNTCGLAQFIAADTVGVIDGGTGLATQGICEFAQPGIQAVACKTTYIGICAGKSEAAADENTYVGYAAGQNVTTGCYHTIIGSNAGDAITTCSSSTLIGYNAGTAITFGDRNTAVGTSAGQAITTATDNTLVGYISGCVTTGISNTAFGACTLAVNTVGVDNVAIGMSAGKAQAAAGCNNTFVGSQAGEAVLCRDNTLMGAYAGTAATTGGGNVMIGACVGYGVVGGAYNVYIGDKAGLANTSGNDNVFIGKCAGCATTGSCCLIIGNATATLIAGDFNSGVVEINSAYCLPAADGSAGYFLCTDGSGALSFAALTSSPWTSSGCFITTPNACFVGVGTATPAAALHIEGDAVVANGYSLVVGNTAQIKTDQITEFQVLGTATADSDILVARFSDDASGPAIDFVKSRNATIGSSTIVQDGDRLGRITAFADTGGTCYNRHAAIIAFEVDGTPGLLDLPGRIIFYTTPDGSAGAAERMRITNAGKVGIGTAVPANVLSIEGDTNISNGYGLIVGNTAQVTSSGYIPELQVLGTGDGDSAMSIGRWSADAEGPSLQFIKSRNATIGSSTIVADDDLVGQLRFMVDDGNDFAHHAATIRVEIDGTPGENDTPGAITFNTTPDGSSGGTERLRIASDGNVGVGTGVFTCGCPNGIAAGSKIFKVSGGNDNTYDTAIQVVGYADTDGNSHGLDIWTDVSTGDVYFDQRGNHNDYDFRFRTKTSGTPVDALTITGAGVLSKASGSFKIEHPLESKKDTHCLVHSFIEGPRADLIYSGVIQLTDGAATINVDTDARMTEGTFVALNRCVRVFTSNESNWDAVRGNIIDNVLTIESNVVDSAACVSWMVVGERQDEHMQSAGTRWTDDSGRVITEPSKAADADRMTPARQAAEKSA